MPRLCHRCKSFSFNPFGTPKPVATAHYSVCYTPNSGVIEALCLQHAVDVQVFYEDVPIWDMEESRWVEPKELFDLAAKSYGFEAPATYRTLAERVAAYEARRRRTPESPDDF